MIPAHEPVSMASSSTSRPALHRLCLCATEPSVDDVGRSGALQGNEIPARRTIARRTSNDRDRGAIAATDVLYGRCERGAVPIDRRRDHLDADFRRQDSTRFDRLDCGRRFGSQHHLCRDGLRRCSKQRIDWSWCVSNGGRRRDVAVRWTLQRGSDWCGPHPSNKSQHRVGCRIWRCVQAQPRTRRVQDRRMAGRHGGSCCIINDGVGAMDVETSAGQPERRVCVDVAARAQAAGRSSADRARAVFQKHRRREIFHTDHHRPSDRISSAKRISPSPTQSPIESTRWSRQNRAAGSIDRRMRGRRGRLSIRSGRLIQRPFYYTTLGADPTNADVVYAGAESFFKSTDGGKTFASMRTPTATITTSGSVRRTATR